MSVASGTDSLNSTGEGRNLEPPWNPAAREETTADQMVKNLAALHVHDRMDGNLSPRISRVLQPAGLQMLPVNNSPSTPPNAGPRLSHQLSMSGSPHVLPGLVGCDAPPLCTWNSSTSASIVSQPVSYTSQCSPAQTQTHHNASPLSPLYSPASYAVSGQDVYLGLHQQSDPHLSRSYSGSMSGPPAPYEYSPAKPAIAEDPAGVRTWPARGPGPELSRQRLYVVVSKNATEEQLAKMFKKFGGMEYCNLKRDKKTLQSKGYCFVNYSTPESAAAALKALNGIEFPPGSGKHMKVMYSEVLPGRSGTGYSLNRPLPAASGRRGGVAGSQAVLSGEAVHGELSKRGSMAARKRHTAPAEEMAYLAQSRRQQQIAEFRHSDGLQGVHAPSGIGPSSGPGGMYGPYVARPAHELAVYLSSSNVLLLYIPRPLPPYALHHHLQQYAHVVAVWPLEEDERCTMALFENATGSAKALQALHGTKLCGMTMTIEASNNYSGVLWKQFMPWAFPGGGGISQYASYGLPKPGPQYLGESQQVLQHYANAQVGMPQVLARQGPQLVSDLGSSVYSGSGSVQQYM